VKRAKGKKDRKCEMGKLVEKISYRKEVNESYIISSIYGKSI
jgi:hypothetical protein